LCSNSNISSKYEDIISRSVLLHPGPPAVYQLRTKKEKIGTLTRKTVGEKNVNQINKTILVVGETGAGKSALINALVNYAMGVKWEDEVWFQIVEEEERSQSESQTSDVIVYQVFGFEGEALPYSLTIIDTPGFGDTRGPEQDAIISQRLLDLFRSDDGVNEVNAVGLVLKASDYRLSDRQIYVFNSVMSLFGKNLEKNIVALITHSDGGKPENALQALEAAKVKCARNEKDQPVHFLFNNQQKTQRGTEEKTKATLKHSWDITKEGMSEFTAFLNRTGPLKLMTTVEVLNKRVRLEARVQNLQERIKFIEAKQTEISQTEEALKKHEGEMKKNQEFTVEVVEPYKEKEKIRGGMWKLVFYEGAVCCTVCEENCHYPGCTMAWYPEHCEVMKGGRCTSCTNKCPASDHVKEKWRYVPKTRRVKKTLEDMKLKYEENQKENQKKSSLLEKLKKEMDQLTSEKTQWLEEAYQHVVRLKEIALEAGSVSTHVHLDFLIEKMKEKGDTEKVRELEEMERRMDEGTRAAVQYVVVSQQLV
ncbi:myosin-6-like, partial [Stegastes partitus]|uniref:Myosin-6-like n=1 Tax=Stegastes partitus TaxID=144197 RepID=A0A9Y4KD75_9TELE